MPRGSRTASTDTALAISEQSGIDGRAEARYYIVHSDFCAQGGCHAWIVNKLGGSLKLSCLLLT